MDALLNLIPGGQITVIISFIGAILLWFWRLLANAKKAGINEQKAKEAVKRAENLEKLKTAADAGAAVRPDDSVHKDPYNRDNR